MVKGKLIVLKSWFSFAVLILLSSLLLAGCGTGVETSEPEPPPPDAPTGLSVAAQGNGTTLNIAWVASAGARSYNIYYSTTPGVTAANASKISNTTTNPYPFPAAQGTVYFFAVTAVGAYGESALSTQVTSSAPAAPTAVSVAPGNGQATVAWTPAQGATSYNLYYSTASFTSPSDPNVTRVAGVTSPSLQTGLSNGSTYYFLVTAVNSVGESAPAAPAGGITLTTPTGVTATPGDASATISWQQVAGADSYNLYWSTSPGVIPGASSTSKLNINATSYTINPATYPPGLVNGTAYYFVVTAHVNGVDSAASAQVTTKPAGNPLPAAPAGVSASAGSGQATISWLQVPGAISYNVYWSTTGNVTPANGTEISGVTATSRVQAGLSSGVTYYFVVTAVDANGESAPSLQVSARPVQ